MNIDQKNRALRSIGYTEKEITDYADTWAITNERAIEQIFRNESRILDKQQPLFEIPAKAGELF